MSENFKETVLSISRHAQVENRNDDVVIVVKRLGSINPLGDIMGRGQNSDAAWRNAAERLRLVKSRPIAV